MSSNNFNGPDWPAGGRGANENADGDWRSRGEDGYGRSRGGQGQADRGRQQNPGGQRYDQQGEYSRQPDRYSGPGGGYGGQQQRGRDGQGGYGGGNGASQGGGSPSGRGGWGNDGFRSQSGGSAEATRTVTSGRGGGASGRHSAGPRDGGQQGGGFGNGPDNRSGGWGTPGRGARGGQDTGWGNYREEFRRGLDRMSGGFRAATGGFRAATGQWSGSFRSAGERLSGGFRAAGDRFARPGGPGGYGQQDPFATRVNPGGGQTWPGRPGGPGGRGPGGPGGRGPGRPGGPGGLPGAPRGKRKGDWWRHWTWKKAAAIVAASFGVFILLLASGYFYLSSTAQIPTQLANGITNQNSTVYYSDGQVLGTFGTSKRQMLSFSEIPKNLQNAVLAAEERSFWTDGAISPTGIMRAAWTDITSSGGNPQGGSTITQEFVRQYYSYTDIGTQQTMSRKIKEIFVAMKLAQQEPKWWILMNYMNTIYLGDNANGVEAASETYFGVPVGKLTIAQDAVIAAVIQQPANYPDPKYRSALIARWHYVLNGLVVMGKLTPAEAAAQKFPKLLTDSPNFVLQEQSGLQNPRDPWAQYVMNEVYNELTENDGYTQAMLDTGGYQIYTTISRAQEVALYQAVDQNVTAMKDNGGPLPSYARIGAELQNPQTGAIQAVYPGPGENLPAAQCTQSDCSVNMTLSREQVGSSFKPYVLATAVQEGMNAETSVLNADSPLYVPQDTPESYAMALSTMVKAKALPGSALINNDDYKAHGGLNAQQAMAISSNTAFTDLAHRVGTVNIVQMAQSMGVNISDYTKGGSSLTKYEHEVGLALGIAPLTLNEQDTMLATVANGGTYHQAHMVAYLIDPNGNKLIPKITVSEALSPDNDSQVQWGMSTVATSQGTAAVASTNFNRPIIAKTGTTTGNRTAYFIGAIPQEALTVGIWTKNQADTLSDGTVNPESLNHLGNASQGGFGGYWPARIWNTFAQSQWSNLQTESFLNPVFTGAKWVQWMAPAKPKAKPTPTPTQTCKGGIFFGCKGRGRGGAPTAPATQSPTTSPGCLPGFCSSSPTATATSTAAPPTGTGATTAATQASPAVTQSGFAIGGVLSVVPGSLLWTRAARRRRRRRREQQGQA